jgi:acetyltransferase-like isoleucine patch superfamily enzyme/dTDP-4-dehydrorhamnose 3,5-epimerase-like enzyme
VLLGLAASPWSENNVTPPHRKSIRMGPITEIEQASLAEAARAGARHHRFSVIDPAATVGESCSIGPHAFIDEMAVVGDHCVIESGAHLSRGTVLERNVFIGAHVAFASAPGATQRPVVVQQGAWIGANASIVAAGIVIGAKAVIRPGAVVTRSVPPGAIVEGNPANIIGYVDAAQGPVGGAAAVKGAKVETTAVKGVTVHHFPVIPDLRGNLSVGEFDREIPFKPLRYFLVFGVPSRELRGEHAHHKCHQFLICLRGSCAVVADDGTHRVEVMLDSPDRGMYLPPLTWGVQYKYSSDAMLLVFASDYYEREDYIRDYAEFIAKVQA